MIGGLTYIYVIDRGEGVPQPTSDVMQSFADYNEAMSYAKWIGSTQLGTNAYVTVWNWNGGSGYWLDTTFSPTANTNYPTP